MHAYLEVVKVMNRLTYETINDVKYCRKQWDNKQHTNSIFNLQLGQFQKTKSILKTKRLFAIQFAADTYNCIYLHVIIDPITIATIIMTMSATFTKQIINMMY